MRDKLVLRREGWDRFLVVQVLSPRAMGWEEERRTYHLGLRFWLGLS